jgi:hypothetical protein
LRDEDRLLPLVGNEGRHSLVGNQGHHLPVGDEGRFLRPVGDEGRFLRPVGDEGRLFSPVGNRGHLFLVGDEGLSSVGRYQNSGNSSYERAGQLGGVLAADHPCPGSIRSSEHAGDEQRDVKRGFSRRRICGRSGHDRHIGRYRSGWLVGRANVLSGFVQRLSHL